MKRILTLLLIIVSTYLQGQVHRDYKPLLKVASPLKTNATHDSAYFVLDSSGAVSNLRMNADTLQIRINGVWVNAFYNIATASDTLTFTHKSITWTSFKWAGAGINQDALLILNADGSLYETNSPTTTNAYLKYNGLSVNFGALLVNASTDINSGTLPIARGGTNAGTSAGALNNLLPSQTSNSGLFLTTDGTNASWAAPSGGALSGLTTEGILYATGTTSATSGSTLKWDNTNSLMKLPTIIGTEVTNIYGSGNDTSLAIVASQADAGGLQSALTIWKPGGFSFGNMAFDFQPNNSVYGVPTLTMPNSGALDLFSYRSWQGPAGGAYNMFFTTKSGGGSALTRLNFTGNANVSPIQMYNTQLSISNTTSALTPTALLDIDASSSSYASFRLHSGSTPSSPNDGEGWYDGTHFQFRISSTTYQLDQQAVSNNYTPTLTNTTNITSSSLTQASYIKVGNIVFVNIGGSITPTSTNTNTTLSITLPVTTATTSQTYIGSGTMAQNGGGMQAAGIIVSINGSNSATINFYATQNTSGNYNATFCYKL